MDGTRFDSLTRALTEARSRRAALAPLLGGTLGLLGLAETTAKKHNRKGKKQPCLPCKKRNTNGKCKKTKADGTVCAGGTCQGGSCVETMLPLLPPPPGCVPEPLATTCAPGCGPRTNNCNQSVTCPCPTGQDCLPNGTCARPCITDLQCGGCTSTNLCSIASSDGPMYCIDPTAPMCATLQPCTPADTTGCPQGFVCLANCGMAGARCDAVAVCPAL